MIPEKTGSSQYPPFIKQADLNKGQRIKILTEFSPPSNPKIQSPLIANVELDGIEMTLTINWTTYYNIAPIYGKDTAGWVGKELEFLGMKQMGKGRGYAWGTYESIKTT